MAQHHADTGRPPGWGVPLGVGTGAGVGLVVGILFDQLALGLAVGAGLGLVTAAALTALSDVPDDRRHRVAATAVAIAGTGVAITALVLWRL
jgi:uncharacterized membrane protein